MTRNQRDWKDISFSSDFKDYDGKYSNRHIIDDKAVNKEIKKLTRILGPDCSQFFKIYIKKKSDKYVLLHLTGENKFISKSVYGDIQYTAFTVNKNIKIKVSNFQDYDIEREKANIIRKEVEHWNGKKHYYTSPAGRRISRILRTSRKDFNVTVNKLLEKIKPGKILVSSNFVPKVQQNILGIKKKKMCVKCGSIFKPINWMGWSKRYLSIFNVYNCEKCNFKLGELIAEEKDKRKEFRTKMLKLLIIPVVNVILLIVTFFLQGMPLTIIFGITLIPLTSFFFVKYAKELKRRNTILDSIIPLHTKEEISKIEERIIQDLSKFTGQPEKLNQLESEINELISLENKAKIKTEIRSSKNYIDQLNNIKKLLDEKKENLERKLKLVMQKVTILLSKPVMKKVQELKIELVASISICKKNNLKNLQVTLNKSLVDIESLLKEMQVIELELINYENAFSKGEFGYIIGTIEILKKKIQEKNLIEFFERLDNLIKNSIKGLKEKYTQITCDIQRADDEMEHHNFDEAKKIIVSSKELAKSMRLEYLKEEIYTIDFDQKLYQINQLEKVFIVHQALLKSSERYPRITLRELVDRVKFGKAEVKEIVKQFIIDKIIPANYDDASDGIEFKGIMEEIDKLLVTFEDWSKKGEDKKKLN